MSESFDKAKSLILEELAEGFEGTAQDFCEVLGHKIETENDHLVSLALADLVLDGKAKLVDYEIMFDDGEQFRPSEYATPCYSGIYGNPMFYPRIQDERILKKISDAFTYKLISDKVKENENKFLELRLYWVFILDEITGSRILWNIQSKGEPTPIAFNVFKNDYKFKRKLAKKFPDCKGLNITNNAVYANIGELEKYRKELEEWDVHFWDDFNTNKNSEYRKLVAEAIKDNLVYVLKGNVMIPIEQTDYSFDCNGMLYKKGVPEIA